MRAPGSVAGSWRDWHDGSRPPRVAVSACLLGEEVRHDGGHALDRFVATQLGRWVEWAPVCPEMELGLGAPRPTLRLIDAGEGPRLISRDGERDLTDPMRELAARRVDALESEGLDGWILKKNSPSCGLARIRVHRGQGLLHRHGQGVFAAELLARCPTLPVEEEGRLTDPGLRDAFLAALFARNRWRAFLERAPGRAELVGFHTAHKLLLRSRSVSVHGELGRLVARAAELDRRELLDRYGALFLAALRRRAAPRAHVDVLQHALGYFKRDLAPRSRRSIAASIEDYRQGHLPLAVPLELLRFNAVERETAYLLGQLYFDPYPLELRPRPVG